MSDKANEMSSLFPWMSALNILPSQIKLWTAEAPQRKLQLEWLLTSGRVNPQEYLLWARDHFHLAILPDEAIPDTADPKTWEKFQSQGIWNPLLIPLCEWDGVLFVAALEPPYNLPPGPHIRFVLASPAALQLAWHIQTQNKAAANPANLNAHPTPSPQSDGSPEGLSGFSLPPESTSPFINKDLATDPEAKQNTPQGDGEPDGLSIKPSEAFEFNFDSLWKNPESSAASIAKANAKDSDSEANAISSSGAKPIVALQSSDQVIEDLDDLTPISFASDRRNKKNSETSESSTVEAVSPDFDPTARPIAPSAEPQDLPGMDYETLTGIRNDERSTTIVAQFFDQMHQHFTHTMILIMSKGRLKPWKWSSNWTNSGKEAESGFFVDEPSLFRIVCTTKNSFHGPVVVVPANMKFFNQWGFKVPPAHVTACPLMYGDRVVGAVLCLGEKEANTSSNLAKAEEATDFLAEQLGNFTTQAA